MRIVRHTRRFTRKRCSLPTFQPGVRNCSTTLTFLYCRLLHIHLPRHNQTPHCLSLTFQSRPQPELPVFSPGLPQTVPTLLRVIPLHTTGICPGVLTNFQGARVPSANTWAPNQTLPPVRPPFRAPLHAFPIWGLRTLPSLQAPSRCLLLPGAAKLVTSCPLFPGGGQPPFAGSLSHWVATLCFLGHSNPRPTFRPLHPGGHPPPDLRLISGVPHLNPTDIWLLSPSCTLGGAVSPGCRKLSALIVRGLSPPFWAPRLLLPPFFHAPTFSPARPHAPSLSFPHSAAHSPVSPRGSQQTFSTAAFSPDTFLTLAFRVNQFLRAPR